MFQNVFIDVAIGLSLMYLTLSLLCTIVNEFIATNLMKLRSKNLEQGVAKLLDNKEFREKFYNNGLIASISKTAALEPTSLIWRVINIFRASNGHHPSYLPAGTVAMALIGSLTSSAPASPPTSPPGQAHIPTFDDIAGAIALLPPSSIRDALLASVATAEKDIPKLRDNIATWFDDSMDRLGGAYKRKLKLISLLVGLAVALAFNADSFRVVTALWNDPNLRAEAVQLATDAAKNAQPPGKPDQNTTATNVHDAAVKAAETLRPLPIGWSCSQPAGNQTAGGQGAGGQGAGGQGAGGQTTGGQVAADIHIVKCVLGGIGNAFVEASHGQPWQILGWLVTAAALSLGAPFWFDLLSKFVNIRGAGAKPKREDEK